MSCKFRNYWIAIIWRHNKFAVINYLVFVENFVLMQSLFFLFLTG